MQAPPRRHDTPGTITTGLHFSFRQQRPPRPSATTREASPSSTTRFNASEVATSHAVDFSLSVAEKKGKFYSFQGTFIDQLLDYHTQHRDLFRLFSPRPTDPAPCPRLSSPRSPTPRETKSLNTIRGARDANACALRRTPFDMQRVEHIMSVDLSM